jgi:hypothetical protein
MERGRDEIAVSIDRPHGVLNHARSNKNGRLNAARAPLGQRTVINMDKSGMLLAMELSLGVFVLYRMCKMSKL